MTCRHGSVGADAPRADAAEPWKDLGEVDAVKAILIHNVPRRD
jgi:hypothetical protein